MRKLFFFLALVSVACPYAACLWGQEPALTLRVFIYKQNFEGSEPLRVNVSLYNRSAEEQSFVLSDALHQSLSFDLRTAANEVVELDPGMDVRVRTVYSNPQLHRSIVLAPGEAFTRTYNLRDYFTINDSGSYYLRARFFPDPANRSLFNESEYVSFSHTPPAAVRLVLEQNAVRRQQTLKEAKLLLPNEAVQDFFDAQMAKDWERFLLHIDPERLINAFNVYAGQYNASQDGVLRLDLLERFQRFLTVHWNLPLSGYDIKETLITKDTAQVTVDAFETIRASQRRIRYSFSLYRNGQGHWLIDNYTVLAMN